MAKLSVKLNILPGITRDIDITLEDLLVAFNSSWSLKDKMRLISGLDLEGNSIEKVKAIVNTLRDLKVDDLTVGQLIALDSTVKSFEKRIDIKKDELIKMEQ